MKQITVVSGKGGVGKSTISASLASLLAKDKELIAVDCDVDASNLALVLGAEKQQLLEVISTNEKAVLDETNCLSCEKCKDICNFDAIDWDEENNKPNFNYMKCEGCGACELVCPYDAIKLNKINNAEITMGISKYDFPVFSGQLKMGESGSGKVISVLKEKAKEKAEKEELKPDFMIVDSAAGIGCPVIASLKNSDYVVAVTEPTPSGLNDLKRVLKVISHFDIDCGIVINKFDLNEKMAEKIENYAENNNIPLLTKIPYDKKFVEAVVNLTPIVEYDRKFVKYFREIIDGIKF